MIKKFSQAMLSMLYIFMLLFGVFIASAMFSTTATGQEIPLLFIDPAATIEDSEVMWKEGNYKSALGILEYLSQNGDETASWMLYSIYSTYSFIGPPDTQKVMKVLIRLSDANVADARELIGDIYYFGRGIPRNYKLAAEWYERYIELERDPDILTRYAILLISGEGTKQNRYRAFKMLYEASETKNYTQAYLLALQAFSELDPIEKFMARSFIQNTRFSKSIQQQN